MNKEQLVKKGGLVSSALVEFNEVWVHVDLDAGDAKNNFIIEDKIKFFVKQASWLEFRESIDAKKHAEANKTTEGKEKPLNSEALAVAASIVLEGGEKLEYDEVVNLESTLYYIFRNAVYEIYGKKKS
jgi:hypothetical protein